MHAYGFLIAFLVAAGCCIPSIIWFTVIRSRARALALCFTWTLCLVIPALFLQDEKPWPWEPGSSEEVEGRPVIEINSEIQRSNDSVQGWILTGAFFGWIPGLLAMAFAPSSRWESWLDGHHGGDGGQSSGGVDYDWKDRHDSPANLC